MLVFLKKTLTTFLIFSLTLSVLNADEYAFENPLKELEKRVDADLEALHLPGCRWILYPAKHYQMLDVAVIGSGMAGMAVGFGLMKEGISRITIFDENPIGEEGPWETCARMHCLRSHKAMPGPSMGIPSLTFHAWYEAVYGKEAWDLMNLVPVKDWASYLLWYRKAAHLPIENEMVLKEIRPVGSNLELLFSHKGTPKIVYARKVVLATGRKGFGGPEFPPYAKNIPPHFYAHTTDVIDNSFFSNKNIVVVGAGASGFDAAAAALENGANEVHVLIRRNQMPNTNKFNKFASSGIQHGFYSLSDQARFEFFNEAFSHGVPPPETALERVSGYKNFYLHFGAEIERCRLESNQIVLETQKKKFSLILLFLQRDTQ